MLTLPETKMGSRVAAGLCHAVESPHLIARNEEDYLQVSVVNVMLSGLCLNAACSSWLPSVGARTFCAASRIWCVMRNAYPAL
jgi:hypothetical protein